MAAEHLGAPAIIGERHQRTDRVILAHVGAEIAFEPPEGGGHRGRNAVLLLGTIEDRLVFMDFGCALLQPVGRQHLAREFEEALGEDALAAVDVDDALVVDEVGRRSVDSAPRNALGCGLGLEAAEPAVEAAGSAAVGCRGSGGCHEQGRRESRGDAEERANPIHDCGPNRRKSEVGTAYIIRSSGHRARGPLRQEGYCGSRTGFRLGA